MSLCVPTTLTLCEQWALKLCEAQQALHTLQIGGKVVSVQLGEKRVEYSKTTLDDLIAYVQFLQNKVDACNGVIGNKRRVFGVIPMG